MLAESDCPCATVARGGGIRSQFDGIKVYIESPSGIRQGEMPPLFIIGPGGDTELVNYRARQNYHIVDRLFGAAELRLGDKSSERRVRIIRTDGGAGHDRRNADCAGGRAGLASAT